MKSFTDRVDELIEELIYTDFRTEVGMDRAKYLVRKALKKEQTLTRKTCLTSIQKLGPPHPYSEGTDIVTLSDVENAISKIKSV